MMRNFYNTISRNKELSTLVANKIIWFNELSEKFLVQKEKYKEFYTGLEDELNRYFFENIYNLLEEFPLSKIKFALTDSKSIFFTINKDSIEINFEVFYDYKDNEDDVEAVWTIYYNNNKLSSDFGNINDFYIQINSLNYLNIEAKTTTFTTETFDNNLQTAYTTI